MSRPLPTLQTRSQPLRVATLGDNCIDVYAPPVSASAVGGNALNVAVNLSRRGLQVEYLGAVGKDPRGLRVRRALANAHVGSSRVQIVNGRTGTSRIRLATDGGWLLEQEDLGVCGPYRPSSDDLKFLASQDHVHCAQLHGFGHLLEELARSGISVSYDFSTNYEVQPLEGLGIAFFSLPAAAAGAEPILRRVVRSGAQLAVGTWGSKGSVAFDGEVLSHVAAPSITAVDTVGAGDSYIAAFIHARLLGKSVRECQWAGSQAGATTCSHLGAWVQELEPTNETA